MGSDTGHVIALVEKTRRWKNERVAKGDIVPQISIENYGNFELDNAKILRGETLDDTYSIAFDLTPYENQRIYKWTLNKFKEGLRRIRQSERAQDLIQRFSRRRPRFAPGEDIPFYRLRIGAGGQPY